MHPTIASRGVSLSCFVSLSREHAGVQRSVNLLEVEQPTGNGAILKRSRSQQRRMREAEGNAERARRGMVNAVQQQAASAAVSDMKLKSLIMHRGERSETFFFRQLFCARLQGTGFRVVRSQITQGARSAPSLFARNETQDASLFRHCSQPLTRRLGKGIASAVTFSSRFRSPRDVTICESFGRSQGSALSSFYSSAASFDPKADDETRGEEKDPGAAKAT